MNIFFAGNQKQDFLYHANLIEATTAGRFDANWVPNSLRSDNETSPVLCPNFGQKTEVWIHWNDRQNAYYSSWPFFYCYNGAGAQKIRLRDTTTGSGVVELAWHNGSTWVQLGTASLNNGVLYQHDLHVVINGASSEISWYVDKVRVLQAVGDYSSIGGIAQCGWLAARDGSNTTDFSEVIIADAPTVTLRYKLVLPSSNGTHADFTGDYTAIDEVVLDNSDYIYATAAGLVSTFKAAARDFSGFTIKTVAISIFGLKGQAGPQSVQPVFRIGGVDYLGSVIPLDFGFAPVREYFDVSPATGLDWDPAEAGDADLEFGLKSIA